MTFVHSPRVSSVVRTASVLFLVLTSFAISAPAHAFPEVHTVTFFENVNASDPVSALETANAPQPLTLIQNLDPSFSDPGYTFVGWNTSINDSGTSYADGSTYSFNADVGLYAQWLPIAVVHDVTFFENANATDSTTAMQAAGTPQNLTLIQNLNPGFSNAGYAFAGWNTSANGSGKSYADGSTYSFNADVGLYAQWLPTPVVHNVTFFENANATDSVSSTMKETVATPFTLFVNIQPAFVNGSHKFSGWNTSRDGTGTSYSDGSQFSFQSDLVLFAQWTLTLVDTYSFSANGGSGTISSISGPPGSNFVVPGQTGLIRAGFVLTDWNTSANGSGTKYLVGENVTIAGSALLFAQWSGHGLATLFGAIGTFKNGSSSLSAALKSQINRVALTIRSRKYLKVDLFGYTATTGLNSLNLSLSRNRAINVGTYLRNRLRALKVQGVSISSSGQGSIAGQSSNAYSRVEVFGV
jgi:uncharacterized repeat protein (TIGR02543 family)